MDVFPTLMKGWKYYLNEAERYFIYHVYNVEIGKKYNNNIEVIKNPYREWTEG